MNKVEQLEKDRERKVLERLRKRDRGLVPKEIWIDPELWDKVRKFVSQLMGEK